MLSKIRMWRKICNGKSDGVRPTESAAASLRQLFMYASFRDKLLIIAGLACAMVYGLRILSMSIIMAILFKQISVFDATRSYAELEAMRNVTDDWSDRINRIFGTASLDIIFTQIFNTFILEIGLMTVFMLLVYYGMAITLDAAARHQANRALSLYLDALMRQDMVWFDANQTGKLVSQTSDDFQKFQDAIGFKLGLFTTCVSGFIIPTAYCMFLDWKLCLVAVSFTPLYLLSFKILATSRTVYSKRESNEYAKAGSIAEEALSNIKTVVSFGGIISELQRYVSHLKNDTKAGFMKALFASVSMAMFYTVFCVGYAVSTYFGYYLMANNLQSAPPENAMFSILTVVTCVNVSGYRLSEAFGHVDAISHAKASFGRILNLINQSSTIDLTVDNGVMLHQKIDTVAFRNVSFSYASRSDLKILDNFNLDVKSGETIAIVGESGSGKSTLISLLMRFYDTTEGSVLLNDTDIRVLSPHWLRKQIGLVGQEPVLFPYSIAENISFGKAGVTRIQIENAARLANAHDFIQELPKGYETQVGDRGAQLSGGQKQRIAIARALIRNPQILLLDEATSALDSQSEAVVQDALEKASRGRTTFIIAHRLSTVRKADRIVVVSLGKIVESGTHEQLLEFGGIYHSFATKQNLDVSRADDFVGDVEGALKEEWKRVRLCSLISQDIKFPNAVMKKKRKSPSGAVTVLNLFRLGYLNSFLLLCGMVGSIAFGAAFVLFSLQSMAAIFTVFSERNYDAGLKYTIRYCYFLAFCGGVFVSSIILQLGFLGVASSRIARSLRARAFSSFLRQDMSYFDKPTNAVGSLCLMLSLDVNNVKNSVGVYLGIMLATFSQMFLSAGIMFAFSYQFGIIEVALLILCLTGAAAYQILQKKKELEKAAALRVSNEILRQIVTNIRTVVALGLETEFQNKLINYHRMKSFAKWKEYLLAILGVLVEGSSQIGIVFIGLAGINMLLKNEMVLLTLLRSFGIMFTSNSVARSIAVIPNFVSGMHSLQNLFEVIDSKPKRIPEEDPTPWPFSSKSDLIQFKDVTFSYPSRPDKVTLKGFSLRVKAGSVVALVGGSGSGKSTCIQLLERFYEPDSGLIRVGGSEIASLDVNSLRNEIALVQQEPSLFDRSVAENIAYGDLTRSVTMAEIVEAAMIANAHEFITDLPDGYQTRVGERGTQISGGQKQRIAIARALIRKTKIVLLDEATSALDTETELHVQQSLKANKNDTTFIIVAHRLSTIVDADVIVVVDKGRIVESGRHAELMARQGYYYKLQLNQITS